MVGGAVSQVGLGGLIRLGPRVLVYGKGIMTGWKYLSKTYHRLALFPGWQRVNKAGPA
jgi:hypothetical protein